MGYFYLVATIIFHCQGMQVMWLFNRLHLSINEFNLPVSLLVVLHIDISAMLYDFFEILIIVLYCIIFIHFYSTSLSMSRLEALPTTELILCRS